jgi:hypothetical protein
VECYSCWLLHKELELTFGLILQETINFGNSAIKGDNGETMISDIQNEVLAHDGQTDEAKITTRGSIPRGIDIDAGETGAEVSQTSCQ